MKDVRHMIHADRVLAERLEDLVRREFRRLAQVARVAFFQSLAECLEVAGGTALWLGDHSPVNGVAGQGLGDLPGEEEMECLEAFYHGRSAPAVTNVCTVAHSAFIGALGRRGWTVSGFENLLLLELKEEALPDLSGVRGDAIALPPEGATSAAPPAAPLEVRVCESAERALWAQIATMGFAEGEPPGPGQEEFGRIMAAREDAILVLAWVGGQPAGSGALVIDGGVGWLSGDSTLPAYRSRGVQQAVQRSRLRLAREAGCDLAVTEAVPGSASQRNMEQLGFRVGYVHVEFVKPAGSASDVTIPDR